jgi:putative NADH-flavin reductase
MRVIVFGASGATGRELVKQGLAEGHLVTAFVRHPQKLSIADEKLRVHQGDVADRAAVDAAVPGHDAALCALGGTSLWKRNPALVVGLHNIISAMERASVRRLVYLSADVVHERRNELSFFRRKVIIPILLNRVAADHELDEAMIRQSHLDWVIVRPPLLTNGDRTGSYRSGEHLPARAFLPKVSRADLAEFMLKQLSDDTFVGRAPGLMY